MFKTGKTYKTRGGLDARILCTDAGGDFPVVALIGEGVYRFPTDGSYTLTERYDLDLLPPVAAEIPWHQIPPWFKWFAMDKDGEQFFFRNKPELGEHFKTKWCASMELNSESMHVPKEYRYPVNAPWDESLTERPNTVITHAASDVENQSGRGSALGE